MSRKDGNVPIANTRYNLLLLAVIPGVPDDPAPCRKAFVKNGALRHHAIKAAMVNRCGSESVSELVDHDTDHNLGFGVIAPNDGTCKQSEVMKKNAPRRISMRPKGQQTLCPSCDPANPGSDAITRVGRLP